jgi:hypothetical protein
MGSIAQAVVRDECSTILGIKYAGEITCRPVSSQLFVKSHRDIWAAGR